MKITINRCTTPILISLLLLAGSQAAAQVAVRDETVANRPRPELDALGVHVGGFSLFPVLSVGGARNSNIYADDVNVFSDTIMTVSPGLRFESGWGRHELDFGADADIIRYADFETEDRENYSVWGQGRLDTSRARFFLADLRHERLHENRDSPNDVRGINPTRYYNDEIALSYEVPRADARRFHAELIAEYRKLDFENAVDIDGNTINNDDRDRSRLMGTARLGYGFHPEYSLFLQGSAHDIDYEYPVDDNGFQRSSKGYEVALGTTLDFSGETFGDVFIGYLSETYDDPRFAEINGPSFGAEVFWNVTGLTTLNLAGRRDVQPTTIGESAGTYVTRFGVGVDHELLRNTIISLDLIKSEEDFQGIDRLDDISSVDFSARYIMNRRMELRLEYSYRRRDSEPSPNIGIEFNRNILSLTLEGHL
jgi:hypothetical protein